MHDDRRRAESFGAGAERYDRSRPGYPDELIDDILGPEPEEIEVLDVGCGTGISSRLLAARGARVLGVEADGRMAELAGRGGTDVEVARFEDWEPAGRRFDRVTAAQAWHWVDPVAGAEKAAGVLRPGGRLCLFWNIGMPDETVTARLNEVYARLAPQADSVSVQTGYAAGHRYQAEREGIAACRDLTPVEERTYPWRRTYTRDEWLDQLPTHSDHAALDPDQLARVLDEVGKALDDLGGSFVMEYSTLLLSSTRKLTDVH